jgi:hypothetical protein
MQSFSKLFAFVFAVAFSTGIAANAMAETQWQKHHPRRTEVNHRLANQNRRIDHKVADGQMTRAQAATLHKDDHQVRQEERDMASQDGSHITKQEDRTLNQQENQLSKDIYHE